MFRRHLLLTAVLAASFPGISAGQSDSEFYSTPKTVPEFWRAARFEIRTGNFERAAERVKALLDANPADRALFDLVDSPGEGGMAQFLRLRNVPRWNADDKLDKAAKKSVEDLITRVAKAVEKELGDEKRIRRYAMALAVSPARGSNEEAAFALKELRRTGKAVTPVLAAMLNEKPPDDVRTGILNAIPLLGEDTVPGFVAYLAGADFTAQGDLIAALRQRTDYRSLPLNAATDQVPTLWYIGGNPKTPETLRLKAREAISESVLKDPSIGGDPESKTAHGQLATFARKFLDGTSNLPTLAGDARDEPAHAVWIWDGEKLTETTLSRSAAIEYYGLRYARWSLELQPDFVKAQKVYFALAIESVAQRGGGGKPLSAAAPDLYAALTTAPYEMLTDLLEDALQDRKTAVALAATRALGERVEGRGAPQRTGAPAGSATGERAQRPALLVRALDYPDARVQFAAAEALLRIPGPPSHGRTDQIVKILAAALAADPAEGLKPKVVIGDPDSTRADGLATLLQRVGYDVEIVSTGRQLMRRVQLKADVDLVLIDRHLSDPMLPDLLSQLRADRRGRSVPAMVLASPDGLTPVNLFTALARLATVAAVEDLPGNPYFNFYPTKEEAANNSRPPEAMLAMIAGRHTAQVRRMREVVAVAGFGQSEELDARINYLSLETFPAGTLATSARKLLTQEQLLIRQLLPAQVLREAGDGPVEALKGRLRADDLPTVAEAEKIVALMRLTNRYESAIVVDRLAAFQKTWDAFWNPDEPRLPQSVPVRHPEIEAKVGRVARPFANVRVIPAVFTEAGFKTELARLTDAKTPPVSAAEKKAYAKAALTWLHKMASGEVPGYRVVDAEAAVRQSLQSDDLAPLAIDILARLPSREAQQDLANLATAGTRPAPVRTQAADALLKHVHAFGKFVTGPQTDALITAIDAADDVELRSKLLALQGVLRTDSKATGDRLRKYAPKVIEGKVDAPPPKEEPKDKPEEKKE